MIKTKFDEISWIKTDNKINGWKITEEKIEKLDGLVCNHTQIFKWPLKKYHVNIKEKYNRWSYENIRVTYSNTKYRTSCRLNKTTIRGWFLWCKIGLWWGNNWRYSVNKIYAHSGFKNDPSSKSDVWLWNMYILIYDTV